MASLIVGVSGRKRHGKDTFADRLISEHGFTRVAFADPLKLTLRDLNPWVRVEQDEMGLLKLSHLPSGISLRLDEIVMMVGWETAKSLREVRRLMQAHGVAIREHVNPDVWVEAALAKAEEIPGPVVITDVRFPNEAEALSAYAEMSAGALVRIERPGMPDGDLHVSETALDGYGFPYVIVNDGTVEDLHAKADDFVRNPEIAWPIAAYRPVRRVNIADYIG